MSFDRWCKDDTNWALANDAKTGEFTVDLGQKRRFDVVELKEDIAMVNHSAC